MRATLLHVEWRQPANASDWQRWARLAAMDGLTVDEGPRFSSDDHALQAAIAGHGVANGSLTISRPEIEARACVNPVEPVIQCASSHNIDTHANLSYVQVTAQNRRTSYRDRESQSMRNRRGAA